jgi:dTDP-4-amino-4,6-dideoxygalactose transaminase
MAVPMLDLQAQYNKIKPEIDDAIAGVLAMQQFRGGEAVERFETAMAAYTAVPHAIGVGSGTDALLLLFKALGLKPGDEVVTTPFTFFATAGAIVNAGARPVFADIERDTFNLDPARAEAAITERTRAIVPVHLYGQCADMDPILHLAERHGLAVIEDTAQALGARYNGRMAGSMGQGAALSFYPTKNLGGAGEGGMVLTHDKTLAEQVRLLRCHGSSTAYLHSIVGMNSHLDALQAAVLGVKLRHLDEWNAARRTHAAAYNAAFAGVPGVVTPKEASANLHVYHQYVIRIPKRDDARMLFQQRGVGCGVFYPLPLHRQACFAPYVMGMECPEADRAAHEVLALPIYPELSEAQRDEVIATVRDHISRG